MIAEKTNSPTRKLKKSQELSVSHIGPGNILNVMVVYVTVGNYYKILDYCSSAAVAQAIQSIEAGDTDHIKVSEKGVSLIVKLRD